MVSILKTTTKGSVILYLPDCEYIDSSNAKDIKELLLSMFEINNKVVLNLKDIKFMDSSALGMLISLLRRATEKKVKFSLCSLQEPIIAVFELLRLTNIFVIYDNEEIATIENETI